MTAAAPDSNGSTNFVVEWNAVAGRDYNILRRANLVYGEFLPLAEGIWYPHNSYTDTVEAAHSENFYRVDVQLQ